MSIQTRRVIDLRKVNYAEYFYVNQEGNCKRTKLPYHPTVRGIEIAAGLALPHHSYPNETLLERSRRLGIVDVWIARIELHITCREIVSFEGAKATSMWREYCSRQFKGKSKSTKKEHKHNET